MAKNRSLAEENAEIISRIENLNERIGALPSNAQEADFDILQKELEGIRNDGKDFAEHYEQPVTLVLHPSSLMPDKVNERAEQMKNHLQEKRNNAAQQAVVDNLKSKLFDELTALNGFLDSAQQIEGDRDADLKKIDDGIEKLHLATEHLNTAEDTYKVIRDLPRVEEASTETLDKLESYGEQLRTLLPILEERKETLAKFNEIALDAEKRLDDLQKAYSTLEPMDVESGLEKFDELLDNVNKIRSITEELGGHLDSLSALAKPKLRVDAIRDGCEDMAEKLKVAVLCEVCCVLFDENCCSSCCNVIVNFLGKER